MNRKISNRLIILACMLMLFSSISGKTFEIIFPRDNSSVAASNIHLVARFDQNKDVVIATADEKIKGRLIPAMDKDGKYYMLMSVIKLNEGRNTFTVTQGTETKDVTVQVLSSPVNIDDWTVRLEKFHSDTKITETCTSCHKFTSVSDCLNCHKNLLVGNWVHEPAKKGKCLECHQKDNNFLITEPTSQLCFKCHKKFHDEMSTSQFVHGPVAEGYCTICHSPHKNSQPRHLRKSVTDTCNQCHKSEQLGYEYHSNSIFKNHPVEGKIIPGTNNQLTCVSCHSPHYSKNEKLMLFARSTKTEQPFCENCHKVEQIQDLIIKLNKRGR